MRIQQRSRARGTRGSVTTGRGHRNARNDEEAGTRIQTARGGDNVGRG